MAYDSKKKKLSFKILASIFLLSTIGFLFVPSVLITTTTSSALQNTKISSRYSAASIIAGAFESESQENIEKVNNSANEGKITALYMKTEGDKLKISDKEITLILATFILFAVVWASLGGILNFITLFKFKPKVEKFLNSAVSFFIWTAAFFSLCSLAISFFWVSGSYSANSDFELVRTQVQSYGYLGLIFTLISIVLAYLFFHDRKIKE